MIKSSLNFFYDGKSSADFGIVNVLVGNSGMYEESFMANKVIRETKARGAYKPYFHGVDLEPLQFELSFAFLDTWDSTKIKKVALWLSQKEYKPLYFEENPNMIYQCMPIDDMTIIHNGLQQGYIKLKMRCDSPYAYSMYHVSQLYDYSNNISNGTTLIFSNNGQDILEPEIWIENLSTTDEIKIVNTSNGGQTLSFTVSKKAYAYLTFNGLPNEGETIVIGRDTYQFVKSPNVVPATRIGVEMSTGYSSISSTLASFVTFVNNCTTKKEPVTLTIENDKIKVEYNSVGVNGNYVAISDTCLNASFDMSYLSFGSDGLVMNEKIYIDCEREYIETNQQGLYRYLAFNGDFLDLTIGDNYLTIYGKIKIQFRYRFRYIQV